MRIKSSTELKHKGSESEDEWVIPAKNRKATYCVCNNIDDSTRYIKCNICHNWYYVRYNGISEVRCFSM